MFSWSAARNYFTIYLRDEAEGDENVGWGWVDGSVVDDGFTRIRRYVMHR